MVEVELVELVEMVEWVEPEWLQADRHKSAASPSISFFILIQGDFFIPFAVSVANVNQIYPF